MLTRDLRGVRTRTIGDLPVVARQDLIEDYRSMLPEPLLRAFKDKAQLAGVPYQSQIKALMRQWLGQQ